jgi:hypothetical protein
VKEAHQSVLTLLDRDRPSSEGERDPPALDPRWVELVLAGLVAGGAAILLPQSIFIPSLAAPALAVYAAALCRRWSAAGRLAAFLLLLAVEQLLAGHDPYTASYTDSLRGGVLVVDGLWTENPIRDRYPYSPGTFLLQVPFMVPVLAMGFSPDARRLYLLVFAALGVRFGRWSLRARGDLLVPLLLLASPLSLPFLWQGETDILLLAGLVGLAWALRRDRPVVGALALGAALSTKLLLAPFALVFLAWLAARARQGRLDRCTAVHAAGGLLLPPVVTAAPFLLWHPAAMLQDAVLFHAGLAPPRYPIGGAGFPALLFDLGIIHDRGAAAPSWSALLPTTAALVAAFAWVWRRNRVADLLGAGAAASLASLYFSRAFTMTYWWLPVALLSPRPRSTPPRRPGRRPGRRAGPRPPTTAPAPDGR